MDDLCVATKIKIFEPAHNSDFMNTAFLLTGGNLGNRLQNLHKAAALIEKDCGKILCLSSVYQTAAWGFTDQPDFYNQAIQLQTLLSPNNLMSALLAIEKTMGRQRSFKMAPRIIDIDILLFNDIVHNSSILTVPHPHMTERRFVLMPLAEIAGNIIHPVFKKSIADLLKECRDELPVHKISTNK
jgi:2-amino-4-hydroxy-6-hydroxymethyldihydropteridine diphosphokinase